MIRDLTLEYIKAILCQFLQNAEWMLTQLYQGTLYAERAVSMAPRHDRAAQISFHKVRQQEHLRMYCKLGDLPEVSLALNSRGRTWWKLAKRLFSYLSKGGASSEEPADLSYVYNDDIGNMAIHYIALGSKPTL